MKDETWRASPNPIPVPSPRELPGDLPPPPPCPSNATSLLDSVPSSTSPSPTHPYTAAMIATGRSEMHSLRAKRQAFRSGTAARPVVRPPQCYATKEKKDAPAVVLDFSALREKLQLYNTMERSKEVFKPREEKPNEVQMYVCGVTVYDYSHIGHARVYVAFDTLYRLLRQLGYDVQYVRNFTDIDDKIIARANEAGEDPLALSSRFIEEFHVDMDSLGCLSPSMEPKATDFIPQMISMIEQIIQHGHAYVAPGDNGDVFFEVSTLPNYGKLSGRSQDNNRAGERVEVDPRKRGAADFALWKGAKPGEPSWPSPWGPGRPGWHIECSSMIRDVMGSTIDIHGGGQDLVFPHHENELAQSQAAAAPCSCGADHGTAHSTASEAPPFVRYWVHNGFVNVDSEKMSKSLGNFFTIRDVLKQYHPMALRWFLVSTHYRQPVNYTQRALDEASDRLYYVYNALIDVQAALADPKAEGAREEAAAEFEKGMGPGPAVLSAVLGALLDDLNTPAAVSELSAPLKSINDLLTTKAGRKQPDRLKVLSHYELALVKTLSMLGVMGSAQVLDSEVPSATGLQHSDVGAFASRCLDEMKALALVRMGLSEEDVQGWIEERNQARAEKDFAKSDELRQKMSAQGILIMDTPTGTTWRPSAHSEEH